MKITLTTLYLMNCLFIIQLWTMVISWKINVSTEHKEVFTSDLIKDGVSLTGIQAEERSYIQKSIGLGKETTQTNETDSKKLRNLKKEIHSLLLSKLRNISESKLHIESFETQSSRIYEGRWLRNLFCNLLWCLNFILCMVGIGFLYPVMLFRFFYTPQCTTIVHQPLQIVNDQKA